MQQLLQLEAVLDLLLLLTMLFVLLLLLLLLDVRQDVGEILAVEVRIVAGQLAAITSGRGGHGTGHGTGGLPAKISVGIGVHLNRIHAGIDRGHGLRPTGRRRFAGAVL